MARRRHGDRFTCPPFVLRDRSEHLAVSRMPLSVGIPAFNAAVDAAYRQAYPHGPFPIPAHWDTIPNCADWAAAWMRIRFMAVAAGKYFPPAPRAANRGITWGKTEWRHAPRVGRFGGGRYRL